MDKYRLSKVLGKGAFGEVYEAQNVETGALVAIKKLLKKHSSWKSCLEMPELKALKRLQGHDNIVRVFEMVLEKQMLHFVFEFLDSDLHKVATSCQLTKADIQCASRQILRALQHMHSNGFFHRDLKPENVLCAFLPEPAAAAGRIAHPRCMRVKLTDFGITREIRSRPPFTQYVSTRWYRAPELVLQASSYNSPIDMWALACIIAELFLGQPLFPGRSNYDQAVRVLAVAGLPCPDMWPRGMALIGDVRGGFKGIPGDVLKTTNGQARLDLPDELRRRTLASSAFHSRHAGGGVPTDATALLQKLLVLDPLRRPTASRTLGDSFFADLPCDCRRFLKVNESSQKAASLNADRSANEIPGSNKSAEPPSSLTANIKPSTLAHRNALGRSDTAKALVNRSDFLDVAESFIEELEIEPDADFMNQSWDDEADNQTQSVVDSQRAADAVVDIEMPKPHLDVSNIDSTNSDLDNSFDSSGEISPLGAPGVALPDAKPVQLTATDRQSDVIGVEVPQAVESKPVLADEPVADGADSNSAILQRSSESSHCISDEASDWDAMQITSDGDEHSVSVGHQQIGLPTRDSVSSEDDSVDLPTIADASAPSVSVYNGRVPELSHAESSKLFRETGGCASSGTEADSANKIPHISDVKNLPEVAQSSTAHCIAHTSSFPAHEENQLDTGDWASKVPSLPPPVGKDYQNTSTGANAADTSPSAAEGRIADAIVDATIREHLKKKGALAVLDAYRQWQEEQSAASTLQDPGPSFHSRNELFAAAGPRITNYFRREKKRNKNLSILDAVVLANVQKGNNHAQKKKTRMTNKTPKKTTSNVDEP